MSGHDNLVDGEGTGHLDRVHGPGPTIGEQGAPAPVDADFPSIRHGVGSAVFLIIEVLFMYIGNNE